MIIKLIKASTERFSANALDEKFPSNSITVQQIPILSCQMLRDNKYNPLPIERAKRTRSHNKYSPRNSSHLWTTFARFDQTLWMASCLLAIGLSNISHNVYIYNVYVCTYILASRNCYDSLITAQLLQSRQNSESLSTFSYINM